MTQGTPPDIAIWPWLPEPRANTPQLYELPEYQGQRQSRPSQWGCACSHPTQALERGKEETILLLSTSLLSKSLYVARRSTLFQRPPVVAGSLQ